MSPIDPDDFERRAVAELAYHILTHWEIHFSRELRAETRSTASANGYAYESVRLEGRHPDTILAIYFRDITRCQFLFGARFRFWDVFEALLAQAPVRAQWRDNPEDYGFHIWMEFMEQRDLCEAVTDLPPDEECNPSGVTWVQSGFGHLKETRAIDPPQGTETPWLGIPRD